jgi:hypothetical protein
MPASRRAVADALFALEHEGTIYHARAVHMQLMNWWVATNVPVWWCSQLLYHLQDFIWCVVCLSVACLQHTAMC